MHKTQGGGLQPSAYIAERPRISKYTVPLQTPHSAVAQALWCGYFVANHSSPVITQLPRFHLFISHGHPLTMKTWILTPLSYLASARSRQAWVLAGPNKR